MDKRLLHIGWWLPFPCRNGHLTGRGYLLMLLQYNEPYQDRVFRNSCQLSNHKLATLGRPTNSSRVSCSYVPGPNSRWAGQDGLAICCLTYSTTTAHEGLLKAVSVMWTRKPPPTAKLIAIACQG